MNVRKKFFQGKSKNSRKWFSISGKECKWTYFNPSGGGGQHKNRNKNGARCKHNPSGAQAECGEFKSRKQNEKAAFERMAKSEEFKSRLNMKIEAGMGNIEMEEPGKDPRKISKEEV